MKKLHRDKLFKIFKNRFDKICRRVEGEHNLDDYEEEENYWDAVEESCFDEWEDFLVDNGFELIDSAILEDFEYVWNSGTFKKIKNSICIKNPWNDENWEIYTTEKSRWILIPREIAEKILVLGELP